MAARPSICFVNTGPAMPGFFAAGAPAQVGGVELQLYHIARELQARAWAVSFVLGDYGQQTPARTPEGLRLIVGHAPHAHDSLSGFLGHGLQPLWRALNEADAAIYLQHGVGALTGLLAFYAQRRRRKFAFAAACNADLLCHLPGASRLPRHQRWTAAYGLRHADLLLAQSEEQQEIVTAHWGRSAALMRNVWPGPYGSADEERDDGVLWVGGMRPVKRPELALELARRLPELQFTIVGGPSGKHEALFARIKAEGEALPNVQITGFVPFDEVDRYFRTAAVLLNTSVVEGFPNAFLHAWGRHKPVVALVDPNHLLSRRGFGRYGQNLEEVAAALRELCADRAQRRRIGAAAAEYVQQQHTPTAVIAALETELLRLAGAGPQSLSAEQDTRHG